jgi:hypothetical protein
VGLALAPTLGTPALGAWPAAAFLAAAGVATAAAVSALALERRLPVPARLTPRPRPNGAAAAERQGKRVLPSATENPP